MIFDFCNACYNVEFCIIYLNPDRFSKYNLNESQSRCLVMNLQNNESTVLILTCTRQLSWNPKSYEYWCTSFLSINVKVYWLYQLVQYRFEFPLIFNSVYQILYESIYYLDYYCLLSEKELIYLGWPSVKY
jgi:hypothetical protein